MTALDPLEASVTLALTPIAPDACRARRTRQLCRERLTRRQHRRARNASALRTLAPVIVGLYCLLYAAALVTTTLRLEGLAR